MSRLERIEDLIARKVEHIFRPRDGMTADTLARHLRKAADRAAVEILEKIFVPNRMTARLSGPDFDRLEGLLAPLREECTSFLEEHFAREAYSTVGGIELLIEKDAGVKSGEIHVEFAWVRFEDQDRERPRPEPEKRTLAGMLTGPSGLRLDVPPGSSILGRGSDADIRLDDDTVSRRHARITVLGDRLEVTDLGSRNGIRFRGREVERAELAPGDRVGIGEVMLRWEVETGITRES